MEVPRALPVGLHRPWPFQDGSLSETLEYRAPWVGQAFVAVSTGI